MSKPLAVIIEDDPSSANLHDRLLSAAGYESRVCATYPESLECLDEVVPELLRRDMRLSHFDRGPAILEKIKADERLKDTRIIIVTAYSTMLEDYEDQVGISHVELMQSEYVLLFSLPREMGAI